MLNERLRAAYYRGHQFARGGLRVEATSGVQASGFSSLRQSGTLRDSFHTLLVLTRVHR